MTFAAASAFATGCSATPTPAPTRPRRAPAPPTPAPPGSARKPSATPPSPGRTCARSRSSWKRLETSYIASRRSRDVIVERFRVARGTLFDVVAAEDNYFESATAYIQTLTELDAARYILLSRTGRLLEALEIDPDRLRGEG